MAKEPKKLEELFHDTLKDIYFAEKKILTTLPKMAKAAKNDELRAAFEKHEPLHYSLIRKMTFPYQSSRTVSRYSYHRELGAALADLRRVEACLEHVVTSERRAAMTPSSIVVWFNRAFKSVGLKGCSSHSGRRTFVTRAARLVHKAGGSLRDVQLLAGHRSIQTTQRYIDGDSDAQRKLVSLI